MARAFAALQREPRDFELRPWLFRIAHNEAISILRRRRATEELDDVPGELGELHEQVANRDELRALQADLADLPERQRAALVLRELNGLSHAEIGTVLELSPTAVKHAIFEARSALFSCREGREMACHDVRRRLSDGDGRVLRGRGVRAHLRSCSDCRRFHDDLTQRPRALKLLAPPLPTAGAATLLSQILGGATAKLLACVVIAGGGTTLAVEMRDARGARAAEQRASHAAVMARAPARPRPSSPPGARLATAGPRVLVAGAQRTAADGAQPAAGDPAGHVRPISPGHAKQRATSGAPATRKAPAGSARPEHAAKAVEPAKADEPAKAGVPHKAGKAGKPAKPAKPAKAAKPVKAAKPTKPAKS